MDKQVYVIGHQNPDTDSIAAAIAYAGLKRHLGQANVRAAMAGRGSASARARAGRTRSLARAHLASPLRPGGRPQCQ